MSVSTPVNLQTCRISWTLAWTRDAPALHLDGANGYVLLEPTAAAVNFEGATVLPVAVRADVTDGVMRPVDLPANDPDVWNWRVTPHVGATWDPFHIDAPAGQAVDLSTAAVTPGKGPIRAVSGHRGASAYEVAVSNGYRGTETEWVELLTAYAVTDATVTTVAGQDPAGDVTVVDRQMRLRLTLPRGDKGETGDRGDTGPYGGTEVTDPQVASYVTTDTQTRTVLERTYRRGVTVTEYGAAGDGVTDDTAAIQAAIDAGDTIHVPRGDYVVGALTVSSGRSIQMARDARILPQPGTGAVFTLEGTAEPTIPLASSPTVDEDSRPIITTTVPHDLQVGDTVRIMSQRDSLSVDAGPEWRLGVGTPNEVGAHFTEYMRVAETPSDTVFIGSQPLIYPSYRANATLEQSETARSAATVEKINPVSDVTIEGGIIEGNPANGIRMLLTRDARVRGVRFLWTGEAAGSFVQIRQSVNCEVQDCTGRYPATKAERIYHRNAYKIISSQACGFVGCTVENATEGFDLTYAGGEGTTTHCYVTGSTVTGAQQAGVNFHPACYGGQFINNRVLSCWNLGISVRARTSIISGNTVTAGRTSLSTYGVNYKGGWSRDCVCTGNSISGFGVGIGILESGSTESWFGWVGLTIGDNTITQCDYGIRLTRQNGNVPTVPCGIVIRGNIIQARGGTGTGAIELGPHYRNATVLDNVLNGGGVSPSGIRCMGGVTGTLIRGNQIVNFSDRGVWHQAPATGTAVVIETGNQFENNGTDGDRNFPVVSRVEKREFGWFGQSPVAKQDLPSSPTVTDVVAVLRFYGLVS